MSKTNAAAAAPAAAEKPNQAGPQTAKAESVPEAGDTVGTTPIAALLANAWKARESGVFFNTHEVVPSAGTPLQHLEQPQYWQNVSQKFKPGDTIIAFPRDGAWYAELVVWDAGQNWANVTVKLGGMRPSFAAAPGVDDDFMIGRDPIDGVVVKRRSTGAKLKGNFANHEEARRWIVDHQRALRT